MIYILFYKQPSLGSNIQSFLRWWDFQYEKLLNSYLVTRNEFSHVKEKFKRFLTGTKAS